MNNEVKSKNKKITILVILGAIFGIVMLIFVAIAGVSADVTPMLTWGTVTIDGQPAPFNTSISVFVGNDTVSSGSFTVVTSGEYGSIVVQADESSYGEELSYLVNGQFPFATKTGPDAGLFGLANQVVNLEVGHSSTTWTFSAPGSFPKHLPDAFLGKVALNSLTVPSAIQGVYKFDDTTLTWLFWADSAPGTTLSVLEGGLIADYQVTTINATIWEIPLE